MKDDGHDKKKKKKSKQKKPQKKQQRTARKRRRASSSPSLALRCILISIVFAAITTYNSFSNLIITQTLLLRENINVDGVIGEINHHVMLQNDATNTQQQNNKNDNHHTAQYDNNINQQQQQITTTQTKTQTFPMPLQCTTEQLDIIKRQLPPELCTTTTHKPWIQSCSFTKATKCPDAIWLEEYYHELHNNRSTTSNIRSHNRDGSSSPPFLGINIGCNKGFDALNWLRMGTNNNQFDKKPWKMAMGSDLSGGVCNQNDSDQFDIHSSSSSSSSNSKSLLSFLRKRSTIATKSSSSISVRSGEMHCIEASPDNYNRLKTSSETLGYHNNGLVVSHAAMAKTTGMALFPKNLAVGTENKGIATCQIMEPEFRKQYCDEVPMYDLSTYVKEYVFKKNKQNVKNANNNDNIIDSDVGSTSINDNSITTPPTINILAIDVEGYDYDVLLGALNGNLLQHVEYIEFEYNWMGSWGKQSLSDGIQMLQDQGFVCYWAGQQKLWRITNCWLEHYNTHHWSNIACVSYQQSSTISPELYKLRSKMENIFVQQTLTQTDLSYQ